MTHEELLKQMGNGLRKYRNALGKSAKDIAKIVDMTAGNYCVYEGGRVNFVTKNLFSIIKFLGLKVTITPDEVSIQPYNLEKFKESFVYGKEFEIPGRNLNN